MYNKLTSYMNDVTTNQHMEDSSWMSFLIDSNGGQQGPKGEPGFGGER